MSQIGIRYRGIRLQRHPMSAPPPIVLQNSFCTGDQKFCGLQARLSCNDVRDLIASRKKLTGDFGNAIEIIRIVDCFPFCVFAKNSWPCNFRLLQHNPPNGGQTRRD